MADWSNLLIDLIRLIVGSLEDLSVIQRSAFVCLSWRSAAMEISAHLFHPMLITSYEEDAETCNLYSPVDKKAFKLHLPELHNKWCCGTSNGWLVTLDDDMAVRVLHPFSRAQVSLPPLPPLSPRGVRVRAELIDGYPGSSRWKSMFVEKLIVSSNPLNPDCLFVKIGGVGGEVLLCRATDDTWTSLRGPKQCADATFYEGKLYMVAAKFGVPVPDISIWDPDSNEEVGWLCIPKPRPEFVRDYLVESSGDLLLVVRDRNIGPFDEQEDDEGGIELGELLYNETVGFKVFKLVHKEEARKPLRDQDPWQRVTCLGDQALFLGLNQSFSLPAACYPGYKANHIYFTGDDDLGLFPHDTGEFNLEDDGVTFYDGLDVHAMHWPPVWFKQH